MVAHLEEQNHHNRQWNNLLQFLAYTENKKGTLNVYEVLVSDQIWSQATNKALLYSVSDILYLREKWTEPSNQK